MYSNIERETLGLLHGLEKSYHYSFTYEVSMLTDHKPLVAIFKKDVAALLQRLQWILLCIHQLRIIILYKSVWLTKHNHSEGKDKEITGMNLNM